MYARLILSCGLALFGFSTLQRALAEDWPGFRGPTGMGITRESGLPIEWGGAEGKNVLWKSPLPITAGEAKSDHNQSSPIVCKDRVFVSTAFWTSSQSKDDVPEQHVTCYQASDGKQLWDTIIPAGPWKLSDIRGGYAAPTPATDGEYIAVLFGSSKLAVLDWKGQIVWQTDVPEWQSFDVAIASSPIIYRGQLILLADRNNKKSTLTAYNLKTGEILWEQKRPEEQFDHTTPVIVENQGRPQMLIGSSRELAALDPANGERLWWCKTRGDVTSPVFTGSVVYTDSGRGGSGILVDATGSGDVTDTHIKWKINQIPEGLSSPAVCGGRLYRSHNPGVVKCVDLESGQELYTTRLNGISVASSPIVTPEARIYFTSSGKSFVLQDGPEHNLLATNDLGEPTYASAAVSNGRLFFKGQRHLFCVGLLQAEDKPAAKDPEKEVAKKETAAKETWTPISDSVLAQVKPGYPGKTAGVTVDPATGDVYMVVPDQGLWKSTDHGATFARIDDKKIGGRCETGFALNFDPAGKRLMCFMIYGSSAWTNDSGKTWTASKTSHLDFGAVDWSETGKCFLALRHEAGGMLTFTTDAGQTWRDLQKGFSHVGVFNEKILVASRGKGIVRSDDSGATWTDVSDITPAANVLRVRDGVGYWPSDKGLLISRDQGKTWKVEGAPLACVVGPMWGKSADHMIVVAKDGFHETKDAGKIWQRVAPLPDGFKVGGVGPNYAWDPIHDIFYASSMGKETLKFER